MFEGLSLEVGEGVGVRPIRESPIDEVGGGMVKKDRVIGAGEDPKHSMSVSQVRKCVRMEKK